MPNTPTARKPKKPITGSDTITVRLHNRVLKKIEPAARKLGISKNRVVALGVEQFVDAALSPAA